MEVEVGNRINFLDMTLIRVCHSIHTQWFTKSMASGRYLSYLSKHPNTHKKSVVTAIIDRAIKLTSPQYRHNTLQKAKSLLMENNYPINYINKICNRRIHAFYNKVNISETSPSQNQDTQAYCTFPYIEGLSEKLGKTFKHYNIKITHRSHNAVKQLHTKLKSKTPLMKTTHTVYKVPCRDCNKNYIGQTTQYLQERLKAHKYAKTANTALNKHKSTTGHDFDYNKATILDTEQNTFKRTILEMIHIKSDQAHAVNSKTEIGSLSDIYQSIIQTGK